MSLSDIQNRISKAEAEASRAAGSVKLIAVSKVQPDARVRAVLEEGHRSFGENRVQEAAGKWPGFREDFDGIDLHIIGPLQSNKVRQAMELAEAIHTVDRPKLAKTIARLAQELGRRGFAVELATDERAEQYGSDFPARAVYRVPSATFTSRMRWNLWRLSVYSDWPRT